MFQTDEKLCDKASYSVLGGISFESVCAVLVQSFKTHCSCHKFKRHLVSLAVYDRPFASVCISFSSLRHILSDCESGEAPCFTLNETSCLTLYNAALFRSTFGLSCFTSISVYGPCFSLLRCLVLVYIRCLILVYMGCLVSHVSQFIHFLQQCAPHMQGILFLSSSTSN